MARARNRFARGMESSRGSRRGVPREMERHSRASQRRRGATTALSGAYFTGRRAKQARGRCEAALRQSRRCAEAPLRRSSLPCAFDADWPRALGSARRSLTKAAAAQAGNVRHKLGRAGLGGSIIRPPARVRLAPDHRPRRQSGSPATIRSIRVARSRAGDKEAPQGALPPSRRRRRTSRE
ncbi:hypothetical protein MJC1_01909 [Methylocystis sp. MJC1]|nr:hypothetical protein MJC1_01909 [Methylocystis sp. MJC1]